MKEKVHCIPYTVIPNQDYHSLLIQFHLKTNFVYGFLRYTSMFHQNVQKFDIPE